MTTVSAQCAQCGYVKADMACMIPSVDQNGQTRGCGGLLMYDRSRGTVSCKFCDRINGRDYANDKVNFRCPNCSAIRQVRITPNQPLSRVVSMFKTCTF